MFLFSCGTNNSFAHIAENHWRQIARIYTDKKSMTKSPNGPFIAKIVELSRKTNGTQHFFLDLIEDNFKILKKIIKGRPEELIQIINGFNNNIFWGRYPPIFTNVNGKKVPTGFGKIISNTFNYCKFSKKRKAWCAYNLCEQLGINVCPYCNRNYTFTLKAKDNGIVRPELDHFLSKSQYPYLSLSFYNLIPSCHICNSNLKNIHEFNFETYLHPYVESFDKIVKFSVKFKSRHLLNRNEILQHFGVNFFYGDNTSFQIVLKAKTRERLELKRAMRNIRVFRIRELYNEHKDIVQEIIQSSYIYNDSYIDSLLNNYKGILFRNREDVLRHVTGNYPNPDQMANRPFSKLSKDIFTEFGITY